MLRITVELIPFGVEENKRKLVEMVIANAGDTDNGCNYEGWISADHWVNEGPRYGKVKNYDRYQSVWKLITEMAKACLSKSKQKIDQNESSLAQRLRKTLK